MVKDKVCIVTGAARGIGAAIVKKLAENGAQVAFTYISDSSAERAAVLENELSKDGIKVKAYKSNAADFVQCETLVNDVLKDFGKIDVCINNAGISKDNLLLRLAPDQWNDVINVNLNSVYNMTKQVIRPMIKARSGNIINMSSIIGIRGNAGQASYAASKAGIIGFTKSVALELGSRNIRCNAIAPGFIETDMTHYLKEGTAADNFLKDIPLGRFGKADEVANLALFLASDMSAYITGEVISICGGLSI
ncbi:3-oxoacyl-[acyl-carrier-protein] reductase [Parafilimonas sp.]|uniref:3-oxoacyl-[acyl-carrier-protein] reductase n=1 Tax=Parafilimonas sp. TaxID=1969739 RepID=UPI003F800D91